MSGTEQTQSKADLISERQSNLPLPEQPPVASDWNSADASINAEDGVRSEPFQHGAGALREPAAGDSAFRTDGEANQTNTLGQGAGREGKDGLGGIPSDAVTRDAKNAAGTVDTINADKGYPKNDPSSGL